MKDLSPIVDKFHESRIVVLGDFVVDEYIFGTTRRISREAPVLIVSEEKRDTRLGSAGNVVANVRALGGWAFPVGLIGVDDMGSRLMEMMANRGIDTDGLLVDPARFTTTKTRILAGGRNTIRQQMLRIDRLNEEHVSQDVRVMLVDNLRRALESADALVVSDYGEGVIEAELIDEVLRIINENKLPVFVDSRFRVEHFHGADTLTPNEPELWGASKQDVAKDKGLEKAGRWMLQFTGCKAALVKRGRKGMALFMPDRETIKVPAFGLEEVADVTGAGDTVLAAYSLARTAGAAPDEAVHVANVAGGIKVTKSGTAVVEASELKPALKQLAQSK